MVRAMYRILLYWNDFVSVFFPRQCYGCHCLLPNSLRLLCLSCQNKIAKTYFEMRDKTPIHVLLVGKASIAYGTSYCYYYKKGVVQNLIHMMKYKGQTQIGDYFGTQLGHQLKNHQGFSSCQVIVPVPLHWIRKLKRGYNQLDSFGNRLSKILNIPYRTDILERFKHTQTLIDKSKNERWKEVENAFKIRAPLHNNFTHVLLIDDVMTTGSTIAACCKCLSKTLNTQISVVTIAFRHQ